MVVVGMGSEVVEALLHELRQYDDLRLAAVLTGEHVDLALHGNEPGVQFIEAAHATEPVDGTVNHGQPLADLSDVGHGQTEVSIGAQGLCLQALLAQELCQLHRPVCQFLVILAHTRGHHQQLEHVLAEVHIALSLLVVQQGLADDGGGVLLKHGA